jgi:hypothetical protein
MFGFRGFNEIPEVNSAVSLRLRKQLLQFQQDRGILKKLQQIIFPQKGSYQPKTMSKVVWLPQSH